MRWQFPPARLYPRPRLPPQCPVYCALSKYTFQVVQYHNLIVDASEVRSDSVNVRTLILSNDSYETNYPGSAVSSDI
jgi:hypothetical protein